MGNTVRAAGRLKRVILALLLAGLLSLTLLEGAVIAGCNSDIKDQPDAVIVLGANLWGTAPSPALRNRLDAALDYLDELAQEGCYPVVVVTGGQGDDEVMTEAACMALYLQDHGLDEDRILREDTSTNTAENLKNGKAVLERAGIEVQSVTIVSNDFHLTRVRLLSGRLLPQWNCSTLAAPMPDAKSALYSYLREAAALIKSFLLDR